MKKGARSLRIIIITMYAISCGALAVYAGPPIPGFIKPKPDLTATIKITVRSTYQGHNHQGICRGLAVICTATNRGKSDAKEFRVMLEAKAQKKGPHSNPKWKLMFKSDKLTLKPGQHDTRGILTDGTHEFDWCEFHSGKVAFRYTVDYENKVSEENENNNRVMVRFPIKPLGLKKRGALPALKPVKAK